MDLTKLCLPDAIEVEGRHYKIKTGHPYWFRFVEILGQKNIFLTDLDYLYVDDIPEDRQAGFDGLQKFYYEKKELPRVTEPSNERIIDFAIDADLLYAGIMQCYKIDLQENELHWHKVRALISGLNGTKLNEIMGYRCSTSKLPEYRKLKEAWALPEKELEGMKEFRDLFYNA